MATASAAGNLETLNSDSRGQRLQGARRSVKISKDIIATGGNPLLILVIHIHHSLASEVQGECGSQEGQQADLNHRVVQHGGLGLGSILLVTVLELPADSSVAGSNGDTASQRATGLHDDGRTDPSHSAVNSLGVGLEHILAGVGVDLGEFGHHADVRHLVVVEQQEAVVHGVVAELGADVANMNALQRLVGLHVADLDNEGVRSVGLALDDQLGHNAGVVGHLSERANPPLARRDMRRVDGEGLVLGVPGGGGLETTHVGSVAQLGLGVATDDLVLLSGLGKALLLLGSSLVLQSNLISSVQEAVAVRKMHLQQTCHRAGCKGGAR